MTLIERLEKAEAGSRELDAEIAPLDGRVCANVETQLWKKVVDGHLFIGLPHYTTSLDAALTLVPQPWRVYAMQQETWPNDAVQRWFAGLDHIPHTESMMGKARTPALALCIAALKARSTP